MKTTRNASTKGGKTATASAKSGAAKATPTKSAAKVPRSKAASAEEEDGDIFALIGKSENIEQAAVAMQAMAHQLRIKILCLLSSGEMIVQEIVDAVGTTQSNVSQHLGILKASGLIASRKDATRIYYRIADARILKMISLTRDIFCAT